MKSDSDCQCSSESDSQRENVVPATEKSALPSSRSDLVVPESSDKDDITQNIQDLNLGCQGYHECINTQFSSELCSLFI